MEHEVFVPVMAPSLRRTLGDPARVARCVPGLQQDAEETAGPLAGRLKIRVGGHTITYRGMLRLSGPDGDCIAVTGEGTEARGTGAVTLELTIGLMETDGGTTLVFTGTASGDGRLKELDPAAALAAAHRLLDRFTQQLVTETLASHEKEAKPAATESGAEAEPSPGPAEDAERPAAGAGQSAAGAERPGAEDDEDLRAEALHDDVDDADHPDADHSDSDADSDDSADSDDAGGGPPADGKGSVFDAPVPPPSLDPVAEVEFTVPDEPPAEAAHARRTMIGRSAEEVDHAPPRGRYAPVPSPDANGAGTALRWVAPAAALAIASAVVLGRALRRRR
ncbi:SRPBCC domain-containing protein [Streptomyces sp. NBC_00654]|uniref:SRPBCC domain-containing protein n=1 Tax=Streptomyces sp. NBC_00654 TaxID=2975799 RepID=UPI002255EB7D|nr:SRPBCC domain-containing protein [Streptomyces sp. NBC_00654]MCX4963660.1 SRPBCC domain-containing protein [Streptomyces sp. NBC_00654]